MKCIHCSTPVERKDWFCPNCRRSVHASHPGRLGAGVLTVCIVASLGLVGLGTVAGLRLWNGARSGARPESVGVSVQDAPQVTVRSPVADGATATTQPGSVKPPSTDSAAPAVPATPQPAPSSAAVPPPKAGGTGQVTVVTDPGEKTFVYLNGGTLLGEAPLRNVAVPSGRHTLVFWTPARGGRSKRVVDVEPGGSAVVLERVRQQAQFEEAAGK